MQEPKLSYMKVVKRIMRCLKDTLDHDILFSKLDRPMDKLLGFCDSDWYKYNLERINTMKYVFKLLNCLISQCCKK